MKTKFKDILSLFITFLKVGLFTFGGGYAMIPIIHKEVVEKKKWMKDEDILDVLAISESTPGPIAVNSATYVGFKVAGFWGAFFATLGLIIPSFAIMLIISTFYKTFMQLTVFQAAFKGIRIGVIILLIRAVIKLSKGNKVNKISIVLFSLGLAIMLLSTFLQWKIMIGSFQFSISLILILFGIVFGVVEAAIRKGGR